MAVHVAQDHEHEAANTASSCIGTTHQTSGTNAACTSASGIANAYAVQGEASSRRGVPSWPALHASTPTIENTTMVASE